MTTADYQAEQIEIEQPSSCANRSPPMQVSSCLSCAFAREDLITHPECVISQAIEGFSCRFAPYSAAGPAEMDRQLPTCLVREDIGKLTQMQAGSG